MATGSSALSPEVSTRIAQAELSNLRSGRLAEGGALSVLVALALAEGATGAGHLTAPWLALLGLVAATAAWLLEWRADALRPGLRRALGLAFAVGAGVAVLSYGLSAPDSPLVAFGLCLLLCLAALHMAAPLVLCAGSLYALALAAIGWHALESPPGGAVLPQGLWLRVLEPPALVLLVALILAHLAHAAASLMRQQALADHERERALTALTDRLEALVAERAGVLRHSAATEATVAERERIAHRLHDGLAKSVAGLSLDLDQLQVDALGSAPQFAERVRRLSEAARQTVAEARDTVGDVRRPLGQPCLLDEIRAESLRFSAWCGIAVDVQCAQPSADLPPAVTEEVRQIVAEALRNLALHAAASRARIRIECGADAITLTVDDDGIGLDAHLLHWQHLAQTGHYGLLGMRERARQIRAQIEWLGCGPLGGASVRIRIPRPAAV